MFYPLVIGKPVTRCPKVELYFVYHIEKYNYNNSPYAQNVMNTPPTDLFFVPKLYPIFILIRF